MKRARFAALALLSLALPLLARGAPSEIQFENLTLSPASTLQIEIAGPLPGTQHDVLRVTAQATIAGRLEVVLLDGFTPSPGQRFEFLTANAISGAFGQVVLPEVPGIVFSLDSSPTALAVEAAANVPAVGPVGMLGLALLLVGCARLVQRAR